MASREINRILERVAKDHNISVEEVRTELEETLRYAFPDGPKPAKDPEWMIQFLSQAIYEGLHKG